MSEEVEEESYTEYFECSCRTPEHLIKFTYEYCDEKGFEENELVVSTYLNQRNGFFCRVWSAIKYVFGSKCEYGNFDVTIIEEKDVHRLIRVCQKVIDNENKPSGKEVT